MFRPGIVHRRALAKIAVNYVAHQFGASVAHDPAFDVIRIFVMEGVEPDFPYYAIDDKPLIAGDKQDGKRFLGHALVVRHDGAGIEAVVSLYNRFRHGLRLTTQGGDLIESRGHFFDPINRTIFPLTACGSTVDTHP